GRAAGRPARPETRNEAEEGRSEGRPSRGAGGEAAAYFWELPPGVGAHVPDGRGVRRSLARARGSRAIRGRSDAVDEGDAEAGAVAPQVPRGRPSTCIAMIPRMISDVPDAMLAAGDPRYPFCTHCPGLAVPS